MLRQRDESNQPADPRSGPCGLNRRSRRTCDRSHHAFERPLFRTLSHPDTGWDHYADGWRVELADGTVLGTRELAHPHVNEQPFARSARIMVPDGVTRVFIRARCNLDGWNAATVAFDLN